MLLDPLAFERWERRVLASAISAGMLVEEGTRRASLSKRSTEKAHFAICVVSMEPRDHRLVR